MLVHTLFLVSPVLFYCDDGDDDNDADDDFIRAPYYTRALLKRQRLHLRPLSTYLCAGSLLPPL